MIQCDFFFFIITGLWAIRLDIQGGIWYNALIEQRKSFRKEALMKISEISIPCRTTASFRKAQVQPVKDTPEARESRIRLYQWRAENNLDIFTGKPKDQG